ncbi:MAG: hypothetical protein VX760_05290, partial [Actinomycetota bacterium]|nr:hypothetical protein [Actinomycetota bacterium]
GSSRWAARPRRDAFLNFWVRTIHEGTFGDICAALYVCYSFDKTFGERYEREQTKDLPDLQRQWLEQWLDPFYVKLRLATEQGLNEAGAHSTPYQQDTMKWLFLRGIQYQIGTFDAAWELSDPWPGERGPESVMSNIPDGLSDS